MRAKSIQASRREKISRQITTPAALPDEPGQLVPALIVLVHLRTKQVRISYQPVAKMPEKRTDAGFDLPHFLRERFFAALLGMSALQRPLDNRSQKFFEPLRLKDARFDRVEDQFVQRLHAYRAAVPTENVTRS